MGQYKKGILGGFTGKVGNVIGSTWRGINYMRSLSDRSNKKASEKQLLQRAKFAFAMDFLHPLYPVVTIGYRNQNDRKLPINAAMQQVITHVVEGEDPDLSINYSKLQIAKGSLETAKKESVSIEDDEITFDWQAITQDEERYDNNYAIMLGIGEGLYPSYSVREFRRSNNGGVLAVPDGPSGTKIHCYLAFYHEDNSGVNNSKYLGFVTIP
ncbi:DUF6266 family protein [Carboxylicivirga sp. RSCT41]|uniref:DUF6266 family protein n=1 Tax=Carboxylicivirga agarovorans TaxID=3417570 RepID=UPI003D353140